MEQERENGLAARATRDGCGENDGNNGINGNNGNQEQHPQKHAVALAPNAQAKRLDDAQFNASSIVIGLIVLAAQFLAVLAARQFLSKVLCALCVCSLRSQSQGQLRSYGETRSQLQR